MRVPVNRRILKNWNASRYETLWLRMEMSHALRAKRIYDQEDHWIAAHEVWNQIRWLLLRPNGPIFHNDPKNDTTPQRIIDMKSINSMAKLRDELVTLFTDIKEGKVKPAVATEMNNAAGKAINSAKIELEYRREKLRNKDLVIEFMEPNK